MLFSSIPFLYYFLPAVLILYFICPRQLKNSALLFSSLIFYAWGEPRFVIIMLISVAVGYVSGLILEKYKRRWILFISVMIPLSFLIYFKYADFFITNFSLVTGASIPLLKVALPIGISFYTFQIISYQVDVYRGAKAQKNAINLATFIALFPQLIAGPIVRYVDIEKQLNYRTHSVTIAAKGTRRLCIGLAKKIIIANSLGELVQKLKDINAPSVISYWMIAVAASLQIYYDFSGYSDMAIGLGRIFGFKFFENFNYPFISRSVTEFWRRWHISLGSWFRDYVYIPMGGNRKGRARHIFNILTVWMLTGLWHGAEWNFIVWGLFFASFLIAEKLFLSKLIARSRIISHSYVILLILTSFTIFGASDIGDALTSLRAMFGALDIPFSSTPTLYYIKSYAVLVVLAIIGSTPIVKSTLLRIPSKIKNVIEAVCPPMLIIICTAFLVDGAFNPFLYFRF